MSWIQWLILLTGAAAAVSVVWYFFLAPKSTALAGINSLGVQEIGIRVMGGYTPMIVRVRAGRPVRLNFSREEKSSCSEEVVLGDFGIRRFLPAFETTSIEFTPPTKGVHEFTCGMGMLRGRIQVEG